MKDVGRVMHGITVVHHQSSPVLLHIYTVLVSKLKIRLPSGYKLHHAFMT